MRTIEVVARHVLSPTLALDLKTEVIVESDDDARDVGRQAWVVLTALLQGIADEGTEDA